MRNRRIKSLQIAVILLVPMFMMSHAEAGETIIQQEKIAFKKCLGVIAVSEKKLSIAPEIQDISDQKRIALFALADGTLTITCDGVKGTVTVSKNAN